MEHWDLLDGRLALAGMDPADMPPRRVLNVAWTMFLEDYPRESWAEVTESFELAFGTDAERREHDIEESDRMARGSAAALGVNVDAGIAAAWAARQQALEEQARRDAARNN